MSATLEIPKVAGDLAGLCKYLAGKKPVMVSALPKNLMQPAVLAQAAALGLVEFGRRNHSVTITSVKVVKGADGKPVYDDQKRQVTQKEYATHLDNDWSWADMRKPGRKPLHDLLGEDDGLGEDAHDDVRLHVRLTTAGLAASAA